MEKGVCGSFLLNSNVEGFWRQLSSSQAVSSLNLRFIVTSLTRFLFKVSTPGHSGSPEPSVGSVSVCSRGRWRAWTRSADSSLRLPGRPGNPSHVVSWRYNVYQCGTWTRMTGSDSFDKCFLDCELNTYRTVQRDLRGVKSVINR
jgi:hypothetical protein